MTNSSCGDNLDVGDARIRMYRAPAAQEREQWPVRSWGALVKTCGNSLPRPMADQSAAVAISYTWPRFRMPFSNPHPAKTRAIRFASPFTTRQFPLRRSTNLNTR